MKKKSLIVFTAIAALTSALLMVFLTVQGNRANASLNEFGIGIFNFTNQGATNLNNFSRALEKYRVAKDQEEKAKAKKEYLFRYDILYSAIVVLQQFKNEVEVPEVRELNRISKIFVRGIEANMTPEYELEDQKVAEILELADQIFLQNYEVANNHFLRHSYLRDDVSARLKYLNTAFLLLGLLFLASIISFFHLFWRARIRESRSNQELRTAHGQLTRVVEELRSGNVERKAQNQFIAAASHDLRQPLHALGLFLNSLEKNVHEPEGLRLLDKIRQSTAALNGLFNGLLDLSKLDAEVVKVEKDHFDLSVLLSEICEEFHESSVEHNITIDLEVVDQCIVFSDRMLLTRIIRNLVANVVAHAPGSHLKIDSKFLGVGKESDKEFIQLSIADTGPGIPTVEHEAIFSEYYQLNNPERDRNKGLGLGLSIVNKLAKLLNIKLTLNSDTSKGTEVLLRIEAGEAHSAHEVSNELEFEPGDTGLGGLQVVVIDDEKDIRDGMEITLRDVDCDVIVSESAEAARRLIVKLDWVPDLIIADYRLRNGKTGGDAVVLLREELNREVPALIITGDTSPERVREATDSGMKLLHKPVVPAELFRTIEDILGERYVPGDDASNAITAGDHQS